MVDRNYMLAQRPPPGAWKQFLDHSVIPAAIDACGALEAGLEQIAVQGREHPQRAVGVAFGLGCSAALLVCARVGCVRSRSRLLL